MIFLALCTAPKYNHVQYQSQSNVKLCCTCSTGITTRIYYVMGKCKRMVNHSLHKLGNIVRNMKTKCDKN